MTAQNRHFHRVKDESHGLSFIQFDPVISVGVAQKLETQKLPETILILKRWNVTKQNITNKWICCQSNDIKQFSFPSIICSPRYDNNEFHIKPQAVNLNNPLVLRQSTELSKSKSIKKPLLLTNIRALKKYVYRETLYLFLCDINFCHASFFFFIFFASKKVSTTAATTTTTTETLRNIIRKKFHLNA